MAFRLPANLIIGGQYQVAELGQIATLENALPPASRVLVRLNFGQRYEGFGEDCEKANNALLEAGIPAWPEYGYPVTPDPDGEPVAWVSYMSSPAFWTPILLIIGGIFLLPILSALPLWIVDKLFPGFMELMGMAAMIGLMAGVMMFMPKITGGKK
ncbi:hypothetical protein ACFLXC_04680 [Chloroflexota bacterium]